MPAAISHHRVIFKSLLWCLALALFFYVRRLLHVDFGASVLGGWWRGLARGAHIIINRVPGHLLMLPITRYIGKFRFYLRYWLLLLLLLAWLGSYCYIHLIGSSV